MIEKVLPGGISSEDAVGELDEDLFPEEERYIAEAVDVRRVEFRTVRGCARRALARLGVERAPMVPLVRGAPVWPAGVVGSMTHCSGYRAAAVAFEADWAGIGVDAEVNAPLPRGMADVVLGPEERAQVRALDGGEGHVAWDRLMFSAKESVFKAWFPLTGRWLGFEGAVISAGPEAGVFRVRILEPGWPVLFEGRWHVEGDLIVTAVTANRQHFTAARGRDPG